MQIEVYEPKHFTEMPWKNGAGSTLELYRFPTVGEFIVRLSVATITEDGPFSSFPNHWRTIIQLSEGTVSLDHDKTSHHLTRFKPYHFDGALETHARVSGPPVQDFNVMVNKSMGEAKTMVMDGPSTFKATKI